MRSAAGAAGRDAAAVAAGAAMDVTRPATAAAGGHHIEAFLEMMSAERGAAPNTLASYRRDLEDYGRLPRPRAATASTRAGAEAVRAYLADLDDRGFAATSAARRLSALRQFHRFLFSEGVRGDDPTGIIDGPRQPGALPKVLSEAEVDRLIERARGRGGRGDGSEAARLRALRLHALIEMLYATGLRVSELVALPARRCAATQRMLHGPRQGRPRAHRAADRQGARGGRAPISRRARPPASPTARGCSPPSATAAT